MAADFKNGKLAIGTAYATLYTCPAGKSAVVLAVPVANVDTVNDVDVSGQWLDASDGNAATKVGKLITVPAGATLNFLVGKLVLEAGDAFQLIASAVGDAEASAAVMVKG